MLDALQAADCPALVIGPAALAHTVYPAPALRPLFLPEVVVPGEFVNGAIRVLQAQGWRAEPVSPHLTNAEFRAWVAGQRFVNEQRQSLWLGWHVVPNLPCAQLDRVCWLAAIDLPLDTGTVRTLCPTDHLLQASLTAQEGSLVALADAALLLRHATIDWQRLLELARLSRSGRAVLGTLRTIAETVGLDAPPEILSALRQLPASYAEKQIPFGLAGLAQQTVRWQRFWRLLARYRRTAECAGVPPGLGNFALFLQHSRHLRTPWEIPQYLLRRMLSPQKMTQSGLGSSRLL